jgi:hypothetical protein
MKSKTDEIKLECLKGYFDINKKTARKLIWKL